MGHFIRGCLAFALAVPLSAGDPLDSDAGGLASWVGKNESELIAEFGKPSKSKRSREGGTVLVYRLRFHGSEMIGDSVISWDEAACGTDVYNSATPRVLATQKAKFYVDARGIVRGEEFGRRKWKQKKAGPR